VAAYTNAQSFFFAAPLRNKEEKSGSLRLMIERKKVWAKG
jgi:hypothetical protein